MDQAYIIYQNVYGLFVLQDKLRRIVLVLRFFDTTRVPVGCGVGVGAVFWEGPRGSVGPEHAAQMTAASVAATSRARRRLPGDLIIDRSCNQAVRGRLRSR